jgi:LysR family transcriptional regulator, cys regulon transcriptional activator
MKLQQLRYICEVARHNLNLSNAAEALFTSQPGISKQIRSLEEELGVDIFVRHGKRVVAVTEPGKAILEIAQRMLKDAENLRQVGEEFTEEDNGHLTIATTHTQARYALPHVIQRFTKRYPGVRLSLRQGSPTQISELVTSGEADIAIATEAIELYEDLVMLPCYEWNRCVLVPPGHPLLKAKRLTLEAMASFPIITYDFAFTGRSRMNQAFADKGLTPNVVLTAIDADVIKTYVQLGMGVGIIAGVAADLVRDNMAVLPCGHLFGKNTTRLAVKHGAYLRGFVYSFIELIAPGWDKRKLEEAFA